MDAARNARPDVEARRAQFYERLRPESLAPLWTVLGDLVTPQPKSQAVPALWRYADVRPLLMAAGELITAEEAERRVLILENPAMQGTSCITRTLYAGLQLILPGEVAPCHRHTQSALRFIIEGEGAFTAVSGERAYMSRGDLILTPAWCWHDHGNETRGPMVWLDGLDIPLVGSLDASFAERLDGHKAHPETTPPGDTQARYGANLRPARRVAPVAAPSRLFSYPYSRWREALETMKRQEAWDAHDGLRMEFTNPQDGDSVMPTLSAFAQLVPAGFATKPLRSTDGTVYVVVSGTGTARIGSETLRLGRDDVFVAPAWHSRSFEAAEDLVLFSYSDRAAQSRLGLWREDLTPG
jgi:gentisate 1,2-dioxygenase